MLAEIPFYVYLEKQNIYTGLYLRLTNVKFCKSSLKLINMSELWIVSLQVKAEGKTIDEGLKEYLVLIPDQGDG